MKLRNLCDYAITDYDAIKSDVESLFPIGMATDEARARLSEFKCVGQVNTHDLPKIENGKYVVENEQIVMSNAKYFSAEVVCPLSHGNKNKWVLAFHADETGHIVEMDFFVVIDDENFAKRGISLKASYVAGEYAIAKAINSIAVSRFPDWDRLKNALRRNGFQVPESAAVKDGRGSAYRVEKKPDHKRLFTRLFGSDGLLAIVWIDQSGKFIGVDR